MTTDSISKTPLFDEHLALKGKMLPFAGWQMPIQYQGIVAEHHAVRDAAGLFDVSHMGQLDFKGEGAEAFLDALVTNRIQGLPKQKAVYTLLCNAAGELLDDLIIYHFGENWFRMVCNASNHDKVVSHVQGVLSDWTRQNKPSVNFGDVGGTTALIALQGQASFLVLEKIGITEKTLSIPRFSLTDDHIADCPCTLARTGYTGEDGFEIFCRAEDAVTIWRELLRQGEPLGLAPIGLGARDTLRLEACLPLFGNEIDDEISPFEARLSWAVKFDKGDFVGKKILRGKKEKPLQKRLVGFEMNGRGIARHGYPILNPEGEKIGTVTSGSPSPTLGKAIGLGYVPLAFGAIGAEVLIEIRGKKIPAKIVQMPFYKKV